MIRISPARFQAFLLAIICCSGFSFLMPLRIYLICLFLGFTIFQNLEGSNMHLAKATADVCVACIYMCYFSWSG